MKKNAFVRSAIGMSMLLAASSHAGIVASFGFTDLMGVYDSGSSMMTVSGQALSSGDFTRNDDGTALFNAGLLTGAGDASFFLEMSVININAGAMTADGVGSVRIIDADGDEFRGSFTGQWIGTAFGFTFASGTGIDFEFDSTNGDGNFNGTSGGSFSSFNNGDFFTGAVSLLFLQPANANFFQSDFEAINTQADGIIIPAPASAMLLAGMGLVGARRRR